MEIWKNKNPRFAYISILPMNRTSGLYYRDQDIENIWVPPPNFQTCITELRQLSRRWTLTAGGGYAPRVPLQGLYIKNSKQKTIPGPSREGPLKIVPGLPQRVSEFGGFLRGAPYNFFR